MTATMTDPSASESTAPCQCTAIGKSAPPAPGVTAPPLTLKATATAPSCARRYVRRQLSQWGLEGFTDDACTIASELVTNAIAAGSGPEAVIEIGYGDGQVVIRVGNEGPGAPSPCLVSPLAESGRGLMIVAALSSRWGWEREETGDGVCVWAVLRPHG